MIRVHVLRGPHKGDITVPNGRGIGCVVIVPLWDTVRSAKNGGCDHREGRSRVNYKERNSYGWQIYSA